MNKQSISNFEALSNREWLVTNGLGGYASSSLAGANTRRYHGLLVAALQPPTQRTVMVSKIEEALVFHRDSRIGLSSNQYPGVIHPEGYQYLTSFERSPIPTFQYQLENYRLQKQVFMVHGSNTTVVVYENTGESGFMLHLTPLFVQRDYHSLFSESNYYDYYTDWKTTRKAVIYAHYGAPALYFSYSSGRFEEGRTWLKNVEYPKEQYRGLDYHEDSYSLGAVACDLRPGEKTYLIFTTEEKYADADGAVLLQKELARLKALRPATNDTFFADLVQAGDQFLVHRQSSNSQSLIAGYHWFTDWGRDTMIAMRGLVIAQGRRETAQSIISTFLQYLDQGMLPNRFPDQGEAPEYNTIDATLWLFVVLYEYYLKFEDSVFIQSVLPQLKEILEAHINGTRYNIHVVEEGFLFGGEGNVQLTWMDARVGDYVVTPRHGCPVEINALWYNALMIYQHFQEITGQGDYSYASLAARAKANFRKYYLNKDGYLNDVIIPGEYADTSIRPNQVYAVSLPFSLLTKAEEKRLLEVVQQHLYTDLGLRTLNPEHPDFKAVYGGDQWHRDTAYHQGTVWPFLIGEYWLAYLKVNNGSEKAQQEVRKRMEPLQRHFYEADCMHGISEIFDGGEPGPGRGCVQQAWSVGMLLRVFGELDAPKAARKKRVKALTMV